MILEIDMINELKTMLKFTEGIKDVQLLKSRVEKLIEFLELRTQLQRDR